jgi:uncharacterized protein YeaO (DUF488 family)
MSGDKTSGAEPVRRNEGGRLHGPPGVRVRRIYDPVTEDDGVRVLVDRLWPRGMSKTKAELDEWRRDVAPSTALRRWYGHDQQRFDEFRRRYRAELDSGEQAATLLHLADLAKGGTLTLLTATKDPTISEAAVLAELLEGRRGAPDRGSP